MNFIILGAGAIGSFYGAMLSKNHDVLLVGRKAHVDAVNENGLVVSGKHNEKFNVRACEEIKEIKKDTVIMLATKATDSVEAINSIKDKLRDDTIILCLQNGYGVEDIVKGVVNCKVIRGITNYGINFEKPGCIRYNYEGYTRIEESDISAKLVDAFIKCGIKSNISDNILKDVWEKQLINCVLNPLTAILDVPNNGIMDLKNTADMIINEVRLVAEKDGVRLPEYSYDDLFRGLSLNFSSMLNDIRKGKKTEIDYINGAVVFKGKKFGIGTPVNEVLFEIIKSMEKKNGSY